MKVHIFCFSIHADDVIGEVADDGAEEQLKNLDVVEVEVHEEVVENQEHVEEQHDVEDFEELFDEEDQEGIEGIPRNSTRRRRRPLREYSILGTL
ncbi:hypothetical protein B9Z55_028777 [Caenorhabditis nigoni]|uniref:Uncharacterized protein n=1 Tax=Caenorhabditis nigoni TaxID=1611254 RepID=A0A2G5SA66_9PELO|nr:hypothetical protein B9Z55_028777 [Caenorhabditis nigoni]